MQIQQFKIISITLWFNILIFALIQLKHYTFFEFSMLISEGIGFFFYPLFMSIGMFISRRFYKYEPKWFLWLIITLILFSWFIYHYK